MATKDWSKKTSDMPVGVRRQWRADRITGRDDLLPSVAAERNETLS
ncbi:hypothetical protein [Corynebacterium propinquum]|nr:hypothetical protein [Corynebacterium propinquum]WKS42597.1 hypothetical protein NLL42_09845 [Corynebacterium propinquum]